MMTEAQWLAADDPRGMLDFLRGSGQLPERKARLFAAAVCRQLWHLLTHEWSREAVEVAERFADGLTDGVALGEAFDAAYSVAVGYADFAAAHAADAHMTSAALLAADFAADALGATSRAGQAAVLRDLFGPVPFGPLPRAACWLRWQDNTVLRLAEGVYEERQLPSGQLDRARLGVLADALEDAGCADAEILTHLRGGGPHVRGCWAVDVVLGRA